MDQNKPFIKGQNQQKPVKFERIIVRNCKEYEFKRNNLLTNAVRGLGKAVQVGDNVSYTIGNDREGYIEYVILNAKIPTNETK
jgi:hypothetical protein